VTENIYLRKDGRYEARLSLGKNDNGKRKYRSFYGATREEAELKLMASQGIPSNEYAITEMTVKELTFDYLNVIKPRLKESSEANYIMKANKHIIPAFGTIKCSLLKAKSIVNFIDNKLKSGLSARYVADIIVLLKSIFRYASRTYGIKNPTEGITVPKKSKSEIAVLNKTEQTALLSYITTEPDLTSLGIAISLYTGIRIGELCALQWKDVDFDNKTITVRKTVQRIQTVGMKAKTKLVITEPKSQSSIRTIPVPECIIDMLKGYKDSAEKYVISGKFSPIEPRTIQYRFAAILKKAKLPSVHFHSLRHAFATNCIALGFDVKTLSEILGHSSVEITLNRYVHSSMDRKKALMEKLKWAA